MSVDKVKLKRLKIEKYRNVAPGTVLEFNDGFNVLLGQNGTGKTTLLELIAMVTASRFGSLKETEFSLSYTLGHAGVRVDVAIENKREISASPLDEAFSWSYCVALTVNGLPDALTVRATTKEVLVYTGEQSREGTSLPTVNPFERNLLLNALGSIRLLGDDLAPKYAIATLGLALFVYQNIWNGRRFDELLGALDSITGAASSSDTPSASFQFVRPTNGAPPREAARSTFIPQQLVSMMEAHDPSSRSLDGVAAKHEDVEFLKKAVELMGFKGAEMLLRLRKREPAEAGERLTFGHFEFTMILEDDTVIPHDLLSYGQKRLLAFLYDGAVTDDVIIADEIVNGMHYDWIGACVKSIGSRQAFLTSQNPLLLDFLSFETAEDVQRTFVLCQTAKHAQRTHIAWTNLSQRDARSFYRAYDTGAQHVSEILRSKGLW